MALFQIRHFPALCYGLDHPEGVAYGTDGYVYAGGEAGQVYRISFPDGSHEQIACTGGFSLGIAIDADHNLYVCDHVTHAVLRVSPSGQVSTYADKPLVTPNYPVFDAQGNLYVSDSGRWDMGDGKIYRIRPGGSIELFSADTPLYTNGMALSPDGGALFVIETQRPGVSKVAFAPDGTAMPRQVVVDLPGTTPDGLAFDEHGNLYIACFQPNTIYRLSPEGHLEVLVEDPTGIFMAMCTNVAFGGPDLDTLLISNLGGYHIMHGKIGVRGARLCYPKVG